MRTFTKPSSHTQRAHGKKTDALDVILKLTGLSFDEWNATMFEYGWKLCGVMFSDAEILRKKCLQEKKMGYWAWFINLYLEDDKALLDIYDELSVEKYLKEKSNLLNHLTCE